MAGAESVKLVISDVDGVLTDGSVTYTGRGEQAMTFNVADGAGAAYLARAGIPVILMSGRDCPPALHRAGEMGVSEVHIALDSKKEVFEAIIARRCVLPEEVCYIGDDFKDVPVMKRVGFAVAVADARPEVKRIAALVTQCGGGGGALREVAEVILRAQGKWGEVLRRYDLAESE